MSRITTNMRKRVKNVAGTKLMGDTRFIVRGTKKPGWTTIYEVLVESRSDREELLHIHGSFNEVLGEMKKNKRRRKVIGLLMEVAKETDPDQTMAINM